MTTRNHDDETITRKARTISLLSAAVLALVVSGCGGGGGGVAVTPPAEPPEDVPTLSEVYSSDTPQDHSLDMIPVGLSLDFDSSTTTSDNLGSSDDLPFVIKSIRRNSEGGYDIKGHNENSPNDEVTVKFLPEHCGEANCQIQQDGVSYFLWTRVAPSTQHLGLNSEFDYFSVLAFDIGGLPDNKGQRNFIVFGVETPAAAVPKQGKAIYHQSGWLEANVYRQRSSSDSYRQRISGNVRIVANFDMSALSGRIYSISGTEPGSTTRASWPTSSFSITDGTINSEGQFTAKLTGLDSGTSVPFSRSVRGFVGTILGQFFGPNADELGGVLSGSRNFVGTVHDQTLYGYIASRKFAPAKTLGSTGFIAGILRDFAAETSQLRDSNGMTAVERIASGWKVTANGRMFELSDSDLGSNARFPDIYLTALSEGEEAWLWSQTRGFLKTPEFNHFDVKGWSFREKNSAGTSYTSATRDHIVHGDVTSSSAMPTSGTATYDGRMYAEEFPSDEAVFLAGSTQYQGDIALTADFANAEVNGVIDSLQSRVGSGSYSSARGGATFNAEISGSNITATDLNGTGALSGYQNGNVRGAFYGPSAEEAAGVFDAQDQANNKTLTGWFGTAKGTTPPADPPPADPPADVPTLAEVYSSDTPQDHSLDMIPVGLSIDSDSNTTTSDDLDSSDDLPFVIKSIRRSSGGGYDITGHNENSPNDEVTVQFLPEHCGEQNCQIQQDGVTYFLWTQIAPHTQQLGLNSEFDYFSVLAFDIRGLPENKRQRNFIVFGVETPAAAVPTQGKAIYHQSGWLGANIYRQRSSSDSYRQQISGKVRIVANFNMSSLSGRIYSIRGAAPGSTARVSWPTSSFSITEGQINSEGQFTAKLTGFDSDTTVPFRNFSKSVRGFVGTILGQFFGPNADELGGVLSGSRNFVGTVHDQSLYGYISSSKFAPAKTLGSTSFIAGILRDFQDETSQSRTSNAMATVERTASGWRVTTNGRMFELSDIDLGSNQDFPDSYLTSPRDGEEAWLWSHTRGFSKTPEFNHFDVKGWIFGEKDSSGRHTSATRDHIVHGNVTSSSSMPTSGTATYDGRMYAEEFPSDDAVFLAGSTQYRGDIALTADFENAEVDGVIESLESRVGRGSFSSADGGATFNAEISGSNITATDLNGTGDLSGYQNGNVRGAFFGPAAEEAAGVFDAQDQANKKILTGWFGTSKDE